MKKNTTFLFALFTFCVINIKAQEKSVKTEKITIRKEVKTTKDIKKEPCLVSEFDANGREYVVPCDPKAKKPCYLADDYGKRVKIPCDSVAKLCKLVNNPTHTNSKTKTLKTDTIIEYDFLGREIRTPSR